MSVWGVHSFENDDAVEWAAAYRDMGLSLAGSTIKIAISDHVDNKLSASIGFRAVAAVEAVALALGRGTADAAEKLAGAPEADPAAARELVPEANELIMCVTSGSELSGLWRNAGLDEHEKWLAALEELRARINGAPEDAAETIENPAAPPVPLERAAPASPASESSDAQHAIAALTREVETLRQEMVENFARLARQIEETRR